MFKSELKVLNSIYYSRKFFEKEANKNESQKTLFLDEVRKQAFQKLTKKSGKMTEKLNKE